MQITGKVVSTLVTENGQRFIRIETHPGKKGFPLMRFLEVNVTELHGDERLKPGDHVRIEVLKMRDIPVLETPKEPVAMKDDPALQEVLKEMDKIAGEESVTNGETLNKEIEVERADSEEVLKVRTEESRNDIAG